MTAVDKENVIIPTTVNLPPKQRAKHRYQLEQAAQAQMTQQTLSQLKKLQIIEERLLQLQNINDEVFGELISLISEEDKSSGLGRCLLRLNALKQEYAARREATDHRFRLKKAAVEANLQATQQHIRDEGEADQAETAVAVLHRQRGQGGRGLSSSGSVTSMGSATFTANATIQQRKRSLPSLLHPTSASASNKYQYARRPSVPCTFNNSNGNNNNINPALSVTAKLPIEKLSFVDADLMAIKARLHK